MTDQIAKAASLVQGNLFQDLPRRLQDEQFDILLATKAAKLERIVSTGQVTPEGEWYDQDWDEWVVLLQGAARLRFEGETEDRELGPGDHVMIPAHLRHRVTWTDTESATVWLALHVHPDRKQSGNAGTA